MKDVIIIGGGASGLVAAIYATKSGKKVTIIEKNKTLEQLPFGGATGGNVNITPIAFLVLRNNDVKILHLDNSTHLIEKAMDEIPTLFEKIKEMFLKNVEDEEIEVEKSIVL